MKNLRQLISRLPVTVKLLIIMVAVSGSFTLLALAAFIAISYVVAQNEIMPTTLSQIGDLVSHPQILIQMAETPHFIQDVLEKLTAINQIKVAAFYLPNGQLSTYQLDQGFNGLVLPDIAQPASYWLNQGLTAHRIALDADHGPLGAIVIAAEPLSGPIYGELFLVMLTIMVLSLPLLWLAARSTHRLITRPILHLITVAQQVAHSNDFSLRANNTYPDELGRLVDSFNSMLRKIEIRDQLLTTERDKAEKASARAITAADETKKAIKRLEFEVRVRTKIERKLTDFQNYLNNIINSMPSALIAVDGHFFVTQWNQEATRLSGNPVDNALGTRLDEAFPFLAEHINTISIALVDRAIQKVEKVPLAQGHEYRYFDLIIYPLRSTGTMGAVIRIDDVTQRLNMEETLIQTEKMISVGGLAAGMAHEINNPLGAIIQSEQNIRRRFSPDIEANEKQANELGLDLEQLSIYLEKREINKFLDGIHDASERAADIVTNMLQFSRPSNKTLQPTDISELLNRSINLARNDYQLTEHEELTGIQIIKHYDPELKMIPCLSNEIEQVILNLLKNGAQALVEFQSTHHDENWRPMLKIITRKESDYALISIQDNGMGMDESTRRRVFEPFFTTKDVGQGTGLGLSVSYFIIESRHNGAMKVESSKNKGTTFTISLPLKNTVQPIEI